MARKVKLGVLASGRGSNLQAIIDNIEAGKLSAEISVVISDNEDAKALERARNHNIKAAYIPPGTHKTYLDDEVEKEYVKCLKENGVELVILAGFMRVIKKRFFEEYSGRIMNIHPALLPSFKGLEGQRQAFEYGVKVSGCSVHLIDEFVDHGPIICQTAVPVLEDDTVETLSARILKEEHRIYSEAIQLYAEGRLKIEGRKVKVV